MSPVRARVEPLTPDRWDDLVALFGERGACGGCWCMWWRLRASEFAQRKGSGNRRAFQRIVASGPPPGLLAYVDGQPAGWVAVAPREQFVRLQTSRTLQPIDDRPAWAIPCFFIARPYRGRGLGVQLLEAAVRYARSQGARLVEGYPVDPRSGRLPDAFAWTGVPALFAAAGFTEVARRSPTRPIVRRATERSPQRSASSRGEGARIRI